MTTTTLLRGPALLSSLAVAILAMSACASSPPAKSMISQADLPGAVQVPAGHRVALETVGVGHITYECRAKADMPSQANWVFVGPEAVLNDRHGKLVGRYFGPPATWAAADGSAISGVQLAVAPAGTGNIPMQLVKANPASGPGLMDGVSFIQRVALKGGVAPAAPCSPQNLGERQSVDYQGDYIFWKAI